MKKSLIVASAASLALAAMPVVATFAIANPDGTPKTDTLNLTVGDLCTLYRGTTHASDVSDFHGATAGGTWSQSSASSATDTFSMDVVPGNEYDAIATSSFNVTCNDTSGYHVSVDTGSFTSNDAQDGYDAWDYSGTGAYSTATNTAGAVKSSWYLTSSAMTSSGNPTAIIDGGDVWTLAKDNNSGATNIGTAPFTITYNVKVGTDQAKGTYSASAIYTLEAISNS